MKCAICNREVLSENHYCELHMKAYQSIVKKYDLWKEALGISWIEYLSEIVKNPLTGEWAKEVAQYYLSKSGERHDVKKG